MPPVIGAIAGFAAVYALVPGAASWPVASRIGLFAGVAVAVGIGEFFFSRWYSRFLSSHLLYHPRRVALSSGKVKIELASGQVIDFPLRQVVISNAPVADTDWYDVTLPSGRLVPSFYAPAPVASAIKAAQLAAA